ncbi:MAG: hypothetical protein JWL96_2089, partial [Sphingomonas bacterium]|nr:hypothetical protein [Sphingomonas bacterium]
MMMRWLLLLAALCGFAGVARADDISA